jgi:hypothetical protein
MKRLVAITTFGLLLGVLVFGAAGSGAWFVDNEVVPVTATAAAFGIQVEDLTDGRTADSEAGLAQLDYSLQGMVPGADLNPDHAFDVKVTNTGGIPAKLRLTSSKTGGSQNIFNNLNVAVLAYDDCDAPAAFEVLHNGLVGDLSELISVAIGPNESACFIYEFQLLDAATDIGGSTDFDMRFTAGQTNDPAFTP